MLVFRIEVAWIDKCLQ